jgi:hypothetical protein
VQEQEAGQAEKKVVQKRNTYQQQVADESKRVGTISGVSSLSYLMGGWRFMIKKGKVLWYAYVLI